MAIRFMDSFDHYVTADITLKWTQVSGATISAGNGRHGTAGLRMTNTDHWVRKTLDAQATWRVGLAVKYAGTLGAATKLIILEDSGSTQIDLRLNTDGTLTATRNGTALATAAAALSADSWYYIELAATIADAAGAVTVHINGVADANLQLTGIDTKATANAWATSLKIGGFVGAGAGCTISIDDLYVATGAGDLLGDVRVEALLPDGAGASTQWTPSAGANYECVDDAAPDGDTTYIASDTAAQKDLFTLGALASTAAVVYAVQTNLVARKDDAGSRSARAALTLSGADATGATASLGDAYSDICDVFETKPGGGAWSVYDVNALEAGVELVS